MMKFNLNNMQNFDMNKTMKYLIFLSFVTQWSFLSMIINLFTMGIIGIPLFIVMILDALTMIKFEDKTIKRPSFILSKIWDILDRLSNKDNKNYNNNTNNFSSFYRGIENISKTFNGLRNKINNLINNFDEDESRNNKYYKERELNKFSDEIGKKITIEYTSEDNNLKKKTFQYKDRATTFIKMLESNGYKDYTKYNVDPKNSLTYIIFNKNKDIVNVFENKIQTKHDDKNYKIITEGWPKK